MARFATNHEAERRLILLKAAFREVAEKGFSNVTLEDIAAILSLGSAQAVKDHLKRIGSFLKRG